MPRLRLASLTALLSLFLVGITGSVRAQDQPPATEKPAAPAETVLPKGENIQIEAMKLYSRVLKRYREMNAFSADVDMVIRQGEETINVAFAINLKGPNKVAFKGTAKVGGQSLEKAIVSDGKDVFVHDITEKTYTREDAPQDFETFFDSQDLPVFGLRMAYLPEKTAKDLATGLDEESLSPESKKAAIGVHLTQLRLGPEETVDGVKMLPLIIQPKDMAESGFLLTIYVGKEDNLIHQAKAGDAMTSLSEVYKPPVLVFRGKCRPF